MAVAVDPAAMDAERKYRMSMKPLHRGPLRQSMALEKSLLEPIYDGEVLGEFDLTDPKVRYNKWATCCFPLSGQDLCCDEPSKAFCGCSMTAYRTRLWKSCFDSSLELGALPPATKPIVHAETSTRHGRVRVTKEHVIIDRVEGLQNHTVVVPLTAIEEMRVEDAAHDMYAFQALCGLIKMCRLTRPAHRLKLFGKPMKIKRTFFCIGCSPTIMENGVASIPTDSAEELCELIEEQMKHKGQVPDGNAFVALKVEDQFGRLFGRGTVTVVNSHGRAVQFSEENTIKSPDDLELLSKSELLKFLKLNGSPLEMNDQPFAVVLDAAISLWGSIRSDPYVEFATPIPKKNGCCGSCCNPQKDMPALFLECVIPKLEKSEPPSSLMQKIKKVPKEVAYDNIDNIPVLRTAVGCASSCVMKTLNVCPVTTVKYTFMGTDEPPRRFYKPKMKKDMKAIIQMQLNEA